MNVRPNRARTPAGAPPPSMQPLPAPPAAGLAPPPSKKRPRSRLWLIGLALLFGIGSWWVWDRVVRTSAYAIVEVDHIQVSASLSGVIESMSIKEDGDYEAGTVLFSILDRETRHELETLQLQLGLLESRLTERMMNLKLRRDDRLYDRQEANARRRAQLAEARVEQAQLAAEVAKLEVDEQFNESELARVKRLNDQGAASSQELLQTQADFDAVANRLSRLQDAERAAQVRIDALLASVDQAVPDGLTIDVGVDPLRRESELARRRIEQLSEQLQQSEVRLPSPGRVTRVLRHPGEYVRAGDPVLVISRPSSLRVVAYFEQGDSSRLELGTMVRIDSSYAPQVTGRIVRVRPSLKLASELIARFHPEGVPLLPVEIEIDAVGLEHLVPGSVVRVFPDVTLSTVQRAMAKE